MVSDTISDFLTRIRNATLVKTQRVSVPVTKSNVKLAQILKREGFIESFTIQELNTEISDLIIKLKYKGRDQKPCITNLKRISKPGRRIYCSSKDLPKILGGMGVLIISTSEGILTDREARAKNKGGELICSVW